MRLAVSLGDALELLEPGGEPVAIRRLLLSLGQPDQCSSDRLQALLEQRPVMKPQQPFRDVDAAIGVDANQVVVERRVVNLRERDAVGDDRLGLGDLPPASGRRSDG